MAAGAALAAHAPAAPKEQVKAASVGHAEVSSAAVYAIEVGAGGLWLLDRVALDGTAPVSHWWVPGGGQPRWWAVCHQSLAVVRTFRPPPQWGCVLFRVLPWQRDRLAVSAQATEASALLGFSLACEYDQSMWPFYAANGASPPLVNPLLDIAFADLGILTATTVTDGHLTFWQRDMAAQAEQGVVEPAPGNWIQAGVLPWSNTQPFRALPSTKTWYFLTADGKLWSTPRQGDANRAITEVWAAGDKKILGTVIDHDLGRSFVFGEGWYLDLGDELKTVAEPADQPWPRPAADAPEIERLRVWRGWVPPAAPQ